MAYLVGKLVGILSPVQFFGGESYQMLPLFSTPEEDDRVAVSPAYGSRGLFQAVHVPEQLIRGRATYGVDIGPGGIEALGVYLNGEGLPRIGRRDKLQKDEKCRGEKEWDASVAHRWRRWFQ